MIESSNDIQTRGHAVLLSVLIAYAMPSVAIVSGFVVLGEVLRPIEIVGAALIMRGVVIVDARTGQRPIFAKAGSGAGAG